MTVKQCHFKNNYRNDIRCPNNVGASAQVIGNYFQNCQNSSGFAHVYLHENGGKGKVEIKENDFSTAYGYDKKGIWFKGYNTSAYSVLSSLNNFDIQGYHTGTFIALTAAEKFNILEDEYRCHSGCQFGIGVYNTGSYFQGKIFFIIRSVRLIRKPECGSADYMRCLHQIYGSVIISWIMRPS